MKVEFVKYYDGINDDMFINCIRYNVCYNIQSYHCCCAAYWCYKTGNELKEMCEVLKEVLCAEVKSKKFYRIMLELDDKVMIVGPPVKYFNEHTQFKLVEYRGLILAKGKKVYLSWEEFG